MKKNIFDINFHDNVYSWVWWERRVIVQKKKTNSADPEWDSESESRKKRKEKDARQSNQSCHDIKSK